MSILSDLEPDVRAAALAYLAETVRQDLSAEAALADIPAFALDDAVRMARLVLLAADQARAALPPMPRSSGPLGVADAQALRLDLGADAVALIAWMPGADDVALALSASGNKSVARRCSASQFAAVSATIAALIPSPASPSSSEPTP